MLHFVEIGNITIKIYCCITQIKLKKIGITISELNYLPLHSQLDLVHWISLLSVAQEEE